MELQDRIKTVSPHFKEFNIAENCAYASAVFPKNWVLPDSEDLLELFNVNVSKQDRTTYFFTEIENGVGSVFDAMEYAIKMNVEIELKAALFKSKVEELKELFSKEPIEKLRNYEFVYKSRKKANKKKDIIEDKKEDDVVALDVDGTIKENEIIIDDSGDSLLDIAEEVLA